MLSASVNKTFLSLSRLGQRRKEGHVLFNDALNTFYLRLYGVGYMVKDHSAREETHCRHMGYSFRLTARVLLYSFYIFIFLFFIIILFLNKLFLPPKTTNMVVSGVGP